MKENGMPSVNMSRKLAQGKKFFWALRCMSSELKFFLTAE